MWPCYSPAPTCATITVGSGVLEAMARARQWWRPALLAIPRWCWTTQSAGSSQPATQQASGSAGPAGSVEDQFCFRRQMAARYEALDEGGAPTDTACGMPTVP